MFVIILLIGVAVSTADAAIKEKVCKQEKATFLSKGHTSCFENYSTEDFTSDAALNCLGWYGKTLKSTLKSDSTLISETPATPAVSDYLKANFFKVDGDYVTFVNGEHPPDFGGEKDKDAQSVTTIPKTWYKDIEMYALCGTPKPEDVVKGLLEAGRKAAADLKIGGDAGPIYQCMHYPTGALEGAGAKACNGPPNTAGCASIWWLHLHTFWVNQEGGAQYQVDWNMPGSAFDVAGDAAKEIEWCEARAWACDRNNPKMKEAGFDGECIKTACDDKTQMLYKSDGDVEQKEPKPDAYHVGICVSAKSDAAAAAKSIVEAINKADAGAAGGGGGEQKKEQHVSDTPVEKVAAASLSDEGMGCWTSGFIAGSSSVLLLGALYKAFSPKKHEDVTKPLLV